MANKIKTVFVCSNCGYESSKWLGKCPGCNEWNSFYEEKLAKMNDKLSRTGRREEKLQANAVKPSYRQRRFKGFVGI